MKFENIDLVDALRRIMDIHTQNYKEDFELDAGLLHSLAGSQSPEDKHLLWMSRPNGTYLLPEREVYVEDSYENKVWEFYHEQTRDPILAYAVEIKGVEGDTVRGNLIELDYAAHVERMQKLTVPVETVAVSFKDDATFYLPFRSYRREAIPLEEKHGEVVSVSYLPENAVELDMILRRERFKTGFHIHIISIVCAHFGWFRLISVMNILLHLTRRILNCFTVSIKTEALRSSVFLDTVSTLLRPR